DCARTSGAPLESSANASITAHTPRITAAACLAAILAMPRGRRVWVFAESVGIALREDLHHPAIKVIHWVVHDGFETPVVFSMSFFNVVFQSDAEIFFFAAKPYLLRSQHFNVLHRNFRHSI